MQINWLLDDREVFVGDRVSDAQGAICVCGALNVRVPLKIVTAGDIIVAS